MYSQSLICRKPVLYNLDRNDLNQTRTRNLKSGCIKVHRLPAKGMGDNWSQEDNGCNKESYPC